MKKKKKLYYTKLWQAPREINHTPANVGEAEQMKLVCRSDQAVDSHA